MFRKVLHTIATQLGGTVSLVLLGIVLARVLGPAGRGVVTYAWIVLGFVLIFAEGQAAAVVSQYAREKVPRGAVHRAALRVLAVLTVPSGAVLVAIAVAVPSQRALIAVAAAMPFALYAQIAKGLLIAEARVPAANVVDMVSNAGYAALGAAIVFAGNGVPGALLAWVVAYVAAAATGALLIRRRPQRDDAVAHVQAREISRAQLMFAGKSGLVYAAGYANLRVDVFLVMTLLGPTSLGIYTLATGSAEMLWKISNAVAWSAFGHVAGDDDAAIRAFLPRITRAIVLVECALGAATFAFGPWLITKVYGPAFSGASAPLRVLLLGIAAYALEPVLGYFLLVRARRPGMVLAIQSASTLACGVLTVLLLPRLGLAGAAAASTVTYVAVVAVKVGLVARALRMPIAALVVPRREDVRAVTTRIARTMRRSTATAGASEAAA